MPSRPVSLKTSARPFSHERTGREPSSYFNDMIYVFASINIYNILWISTGCGHDALIKITERGNGIRNSWLDL